MSNNSSGILSRMLYVVKPWLRSRLIPFYQSLSPAQKACFLLGVIPMPVYVLKGQLFLLLDGIRASIDGRSISAIPFVALLAETFLIIYAVALVLQYQTAISRRVVTPKNFASTLPHRCIVVRAVPLHLYNDERRSTPVDDTEFIKGFSGLGTEDQALIDKLPQALEILKNNAAMLDIYEQYHPEAEGELEPEIRSKSLMDILKEAHHPEIETAADIEEIIQSSKN